MNGMDLASDRRYSDDSESRAVESGRCDVGRSVPVVPGVFRTSFAGGFLSVGVSGCDATATEEDAAAAGPAL